jgi:hypothetical protein
MESTRPSTEDAKLLLELIKLNMSDERRKAYEWFFMEFAPKKVTDYVEYKRLYPHGSDGARYVGEIMGWHELVGGLVEHGQLSEDLLFDVAAPVRFFWDPLRPIVYGSRGEMKEPRIGENFELLAERYEKWIKNHPPKIKLLTA